MNVHGARSPFVFVRFDHVAILVRKVISVVVRLPVGDAWLDSSSSHPSRKSTGMMVPAIILPRQFALTISCPAKFPSQITKVSLSMPRCLRSLIRGSILDQRPCIDFHARGQPRRIPTTMKNLYVSNTSLRQSSGIQQQPRTYLLRGLLFHTTRKWIRAPSKDPSIREPKLHAVSHFMLTQPGQHLGIAKGFVVLPVENGKGIQLSSSVRA